MAIINGTSAPDRLTGTLGSDVLRGLGGDDTLSGLVGNDTLDGGAGTDSMAGGRGNDIYIVDRASDRAIERAGEGIDLVRASVSYVLGSNLENLTLTGTGNISGTGNALGNVITGNAGRNTLDGRGGDDVLSGGAGLDLLFGGIGNDRLVPGPGNGVRDVIDGGPGVDTIDYSDARAGVMVALTVGGAMVKGAADQDIITGVENVIGSPFSDTLMSGPGGSFHLASGGRGNDVIVASPEVYDRIRGDDGYDFLSGDNGSADDFWLQYDRGMDRIFNFRNADNDHVLVRRADFNLATPAGSFLAAGEFVASATLGNVVGNSVRLVHETSTGILWADKDGAGGLLPIPVASFEVGVNITGQIFVI